MNDAPPPFPLPPHPLRTAVVQNAARPLAIADNARTAAARTARAAEAGARLVVFPELHLCAYDLQGLARVIAGDGPAAGGAVSHADHVRAADAGVLRADHARRVDDDRLAPLARTAVARHATVLIGAAVRHPDGRLTNSLLSVAPTGDITVAYDKQHLWHDVEAVLFTPGTACPTLLTVDGWQLGLGVCYDMSFPEHARAAALAGAHAVVYSSAFATGTEYRAAVYCRARALENTVYSVFANPVGGPTDRPCDGTSAVHAPDGTTLAEAAPGQDTTVVADLTPDRLAQVRSYLRMLTEHREPAPL
ncbi:carbon-nitrogen hydrolase family protein [Streptomyces sp. NPDC004822]